MKILATIIGVVCLFGLTWVFGAFTIMKADQAFQIVFTVANSFQGFFIFVFFCIVNSDVRITLAQKLFHKRDCPKTNPSNLTQNGNASSKQPQTSFELNGSSQTSRERMEFNSTSEVDTLGSNATLLSCGHMEESEKLEFTETITWNVTMTESS